MTNYKTEARIERMKSVAACVAVGLLAVGVVLANPKNAARMLAMQHMAPGTVAPEIIGTDVGGKQMKLSDYRGKVVMLDFFGNW